MTVLQFIRYERSMNDLNAKRMVVLTSEPAVLRYLCRAFYALERYLWPFRVRFAIAAEAKQNAYLASLPDCNDDAYVFDLTERLALSSGMVEESA